MIPPPNALGAPQRYDSWRHRQDTACLKAIDTDKRFLALTLPTGAGKSLIYMVAALATGRRTAVLTATKALQTQLFHDFAEVGLRDIRGQGNYPCQVLVPNGFPHAPGETSASYYAPGSAYEGPCHHGYKCRWRDAGCEYFDAVEVAKKAQIVVTNYAYWILGHKGESPPLGKFDLLVMDEAHAAPDELSDALEVGLDGYDLRFLGLRFPSGDGLAEWKAWARIATAGAIKAYMAIKDEAASLGSSAATRRRARELKELARKLDEIACAQGEWVVQRDQRRVSLCPLWPAPYAERNLFLGIPRVILTSATVREKTLRLLGIAEDEVEIEDHPSSFPVANRLITHVPTVRLNHRSSETDLSVWVTRIDQIVGRRLDRKGIIHAVSYERARIIAERSQHRQFMIAHESGGMAAAVAKFKAAKAPAVLVSPSVTTGIDFPDMDARYQIIAKVPFPDGRDKIVKARTDADPEYGLYLAMQSVVQSAGRIVRSESDWGETLIIDDMWTWFYGRNQAMAPGWFREAVRRSVTIPVPLPLSP